VSQAELAKQRKEAKEKKRLERKERQVKKRDIRYRSPSAHSLLLLLC
jgi:hypothetical protein